MTNDRERAKTSLINDPICIPLSLSRRMYGTNERAKQFNFNPSREKAVREFLEMQFICVMRFNAGGKEKARNMYAGDK